MRSKLPLIGAVVAALLVPGATALARGGNAGGHAMGGAGAHATFSGAMSHSGGVARFNGGPHFNSGTRFSNGARFTGGPRFYNGARFARFHNRRFFFHHRRFFGGPFFVGGFAYASSCWRWGWTPFGWRQQWVCGSPYWW